MIASLFNDEFLSRVLSGRWTMALARLATLLLTLLLSHGLAQLTWILVPEPEYEEVKPIAATPRAAPVRQQDNSAQRLSNLHLFGKVSREPKTVVTSSVAAPETKLRLVLSGVVASDNKASARAIIAEPNGREEQYAIDAALPGGVQLSDILPDRVILLRNNRYETLYLQKESGKGEDPDAGRGRRRRAGR